MIPGIARVLRPYPVYGSQKEIGLLGYILRRVGFLVVVVWGVSLITFTVSQVIPGDPALMMAGPRARPEVVASMREKLGLNKPIHVQYYAYMRNLLRGDFGISIHTHRPVVKDLGAFFPATTELVVVTLLISLSMGIPLGILAAAKQNRLPDHLSRFYSLVGVSMPSFWLGQILLLLFCLRLQILPSGGRVGAGFASAVGGTGFYIIDAIIAGNGKALLDVLWHLILPAFTLSLGSMGMILRMTRSSMLEVLRQDYVTTARSKGLSDARVLFKHALRNSVLPVVTLIGMIFGYEMGGAVLVESVFSWPGIGRYAVRAISTLDFAAVMGVTLIIALLVSVANLVVDLSYGVLDPRVRYD